MTLNRVLIVFFPFLFLSFLCCGQKLTSSYKPNIVVFSPAVKNITDELLSSSNEEVKSHPEFGALPYNAPCRDCYEQIEKRTAFGRYFVKKGTGGKEFYIQKSYTPIHYMDKKGRWMTIDPRMRQVGEKTFSAPQQPYPTLIDLDKGYTSITRGDISINFNQQVKMYYMSGAAKLGEQASTNEAFYTAGDDGVEQRNFFPGVYRQLIAGKGSIETNYILIRKPNIPAEANWIVFEDTWTLPAGYTLAPGGGGYMTDDGLWNGDILVKDETGREAFRIRKPLLADAGAGRVKEAGPDLPVGYKIVQQRNEWILSLVVSAKWLAAWNRIYPVTIDPLVSTTQDYTGAYMGGSSYSTSCAAIIDTSLGCGYTIDVKVPGGSTIMTAGITASYETGISGCNCKIDDGGFEVVGPCGTLSDSISHYPLSCIKDTLGYCYTGTNIGPGPIFEYKLVSGCLTPTCDTTVLPFTLYLTQCSCPIPGTCDSMCILLSDFEVYSVTVEGLTIQTNATTSAGTYSATICPGASVTLIDSTKYGVPPYTYKWLPGGQTSLSLSVGPAIPTTYTLVATDACGNTASSLVDINIYPLAPVDAGPDQTIIAGGSAQLNATGETSYSWSPGKTLNDSLTANPVATPSVTTTYTVYSINQYGCPVSGQTVVFVSNISFLVFPDAFSPNNDGKNDFFFPNYNNLKSLDWKVYDRWGQMVFEGNLGSQWDGKFNGKDLPEGSYAYFANAVAGDGTSIKKQGNVTLVR